MTRKPKPFLMAGEARPTRPRATSVDQPDRRVEEVSPKKLSPEAIRVRLRAGPIDPRLRGVHCYLERWSVTPGVTMSLPMLAQVRLVTGHRERPPPLLDRDCELVDHAIKNSPSWVRELVYLWYRTDREALEIAEILGSKRRQTAYEHLNLALAYLQGRLEQMGFGGSDLETEA